MLSQIIFYRVISPFFSSMQSVLRLASQEGGERDMSCKNLLSEIIWTRLRPLFLRGVLGKKRTASCAKHRLQSFFYCFTSGTLVGFALNGVFTGVALLGSGASISGCSHSSCMMRNWCWLAKRLSCQLSRSSSFRRSP